MTENGSNKKRKIESASSQDQVKIFKDYFPIFVDEVLEGLKPYNTPESSVEWIRKCLFHNALGGKMNRGLSVIDTYRSLVNERELTSDEMEKCCALGWCIEFLQAFLLIADDIMDHSETRRGNPCWYKMPNIGIVALNDAFLVESIVYVVLKKHFRQESYYVDLVDLFHEVAYQTELGQLLDLTTAPEDDVDLNRFSMEKYKWIVKFKTAYYSFYLPVALAMYMHGINDVKSHELAKSILLPLGEYFQIQDDYLDCFGDPQVIGKIGTDIQDNKCSWLVVKALEIVTPTQRKILEENYGQRSKEKENVVKKLFNELQLPKLFEQFEEESFQSLSKTIDQADESTIPRSVFSKFVQKVYKRKL